MTTFRQLAGRVRDRLLAPALHAAGESADRLRFLERHVRQVQEALGRLEARQVGSTAPAPDGPHWMDAREFRVWSQWGEDGIIEHLVRHVPVPRPAFVEFGVEAYDEANTRFLMVHRNWAGLVMDGDADAVQRIRAHRDYWLYDLRAEHAFITRANIDTLLAAHGMTGDIGLLSIDIDGMDWWIWDAITVARPAIVVIEYNARLGADRAVTVPYDPAFDRRRAHHSLMYYGASLAALDALGRRKGYDLVGCGRAGLNAFFVRRDLRPASIPAFGAREAFREAQFCEAHDADGRRVKLSIAEQRAAIAGLPLVTVDDDGVARP